MYILKFADCDCWIADWTGDPGRTLVKESAKLFKTLQSAEIASKKLIKQNEHRNFELIPVKSEVQDET